MTATELRVKTEELVSICKKVIFNGKSIAVTGHDLPDADSIISAVMMRMLLQKFNIESKIKFGTRPDNVTLRDMKKLGIADEVFFDGFDDRDELLLVDHHKSFYNTPTLACVDHHTTPPKSECDVAIVISASSCGRVIFDMADACGVADCELEKLAIYSVYLDTQSCQSPKFKKTDIPWLEKGIKKYGIDRDEITRMGYVLCDSKESVEILAMYGYKRYSFGERPSFSTCIQIDTSQPEWEDVIKRINAYLAKKLEKEDGVIWAFVVNMPIETRSDIYFIDRFGNIKKVELDRLASRSRDVIPVVSTAN